MKLKNSPTPKTNKPRANASLIIVSHCIGQSSITRIATRAGFDTGCFDYGPPTSNLTLARYTFGARHKALP